MSTTGFSSWAGDLGDVGAIYPFQGWELVMTVICIIVWLGWHRIQFNGESREFEEMAQAQDTASGNKAIDRY